MTGGLIWTVTGALGAMALGIVPIPLRGVVAASTLAFLAFTVVTTRAARSRSRPPS
ncbi:MAG TPA: hypothetical protein VFE48_08720 [Methylomirabilota bacterium]|nr:hypothetical protein [Methylomirabilota bacterium]